MLRIHLTRKAIRILTVVASLLLIFLGLLTVPHLASRSSYQRLNRFDDESYIITNIQVDHCSIFHLSGCVKGGNWFRVAKPLNHNSERKVMYRRHQLFVEKKRIQDLTEQDDVAIDIKVGEQGFVYEHEKYNSKNPEKYYYNLDLLFGLDAVDPRPDWSLIKTPLNIVKTDIPTYFTLKKVPKSSPLPKIDLQIKTSSKTNYKILQVADLHFSTSEGVCRDQYPEVENCKADKRTLVFLNKVLELENPDLVVLTGDQIFGEDSFDSITTTLKYVQPLIKRKIPYALMFGNHDDEGSLSRDDLMKLFQSLPFSIAVPGPKNIDGVGNYYFQVRDKDSNESVLTFFVLDSHKYSPNPKVLPGYDWIKENQLEYITDVAENKLEYGAKDLKFAFFHIPLPEYRNTKQGFIGNFKEPITAPKYNTFARDVLRNLGVSVVSVGHDHCNDYCLLDSKDGDDELWLCYGGASGEGGYGGYGGTTRRLRVFEVDFDSRTINSYKRLETSPDEIFDVQTLVRNGKVVSS